MSHHFKGKGHWSKRYLSAPIDSGRLRALAERQAQAGVWTVPTLIQTVRELLPTREAARFMRAIDWGTIEKGKVADLVLLNANPLDDVTNTRKIDGVILKGRWLSGQDRASILAAIARTAQ